MLSTVPGARQAPSPLLEEDELAKDAPLPGKSMCDDMVACEGKWLEGGECRECEHKAKRQPGARVPSELRVCEEGRISFFL